MEIKKSSDVGGRLYVTVAMTKIEADVRGSTIDKSQTHSLISASKYSLSELFQKINPADKHFLKYLPDRFLTEDQIVAKQEALNEDANKISKYKTKRSIATPESEQADSNTPKATGGTAPIDAPLGGVRDDSKNREPYGASSDASINNIPQTQSGVNTNSAQSAEPDMYQKVQQLLASGQGKTAEPQMQVDSSEEIAYNKGKSEQVSRAIDRLNRGGADVPTLEEIMAIPEIAAAEQANEGAETINLPSRDAIRKNAYDKATQKGSWNGSSYSGEVRQGKRMDIVIGLPGSGKSSVYTESLSKEHKSRVIDTDDFREYIPAYNGTNARLVHEEASDIRDDVFEAAMDNGDNILLSTIGDDAEKLAAHIRDYKENGYQVYLHLNELPNSKSLARAIGRYISEDGTLGRYVSPKLITKYGDKPTQTYLYLTGQGGTDNGRLAKNLRESGKQVDRAATQTDGNTENTTVPADLLAGYDWYNNDVEKGEAPRLIQSSKTPAAESVGAVRANPSARQGTVLCLKSLSI